MEIKTIKTHKITVADKDIFKILDQYLINFEENSVLAVTSKIVAICEGRVVPLDQIEKQELVEKEAEYFLPPEKNKYNVSLTIKNNLLVPTAGIDESNGNGYFILWPKNPQQSANLIREYLVKRFSLKKIGVIITDSKTTPLRWGTSGVAIAHSGFRALNDYIGTPDLFGHQLKMTKSNIMDALAAAAVVVMGEGDEQTPLAVIKDLPFVEFQEDNPTKQELKELEITKEDDLYGYLLTSVDWQEGKK